MLQRASRVDLGRRGDIETSQRQAKPGPWRFQPPIHFLSLLCRCGWVSTPGLCAAPLYFFRLPGHLSAAYTIELVANFCLYL